VANAPSAKPVGLLYAREILSREEEVELLERLRELRFDPIVMHGQAARRSARHFGLDYDYEMRKPLPGEAMPAWLAAARERAAQLADLVPDELAEILVQKYPPGSTIGWHRDAPAFGTVVGISLAAPCRLRFQRGKAGARRTWEIVLEPRSGYVLAGEARTSWQHSIPPVKELRYSITFRTARK
jgi:alkylated DNA repair protein (DNA oxidative demethylase)